MLRAEIIEAAMLVASAAEKERLFSTIYSPCVARPFSSALHESEQMAQ
jgi:hypothetical protein